MIYIILYAIIFLIIPLGLFSFFGWLIIFHLNRYGLEGSYNKKATLVFSIGIIAISLMTAQRFFTVDWEKINPQKFVQESANNFFQGQYGK
ncbi:MAG: hypothetical protein WC178_01305 [Candidatus Paceibacterota bacterium]